MSKEDICPFKLDEIAVFESYFRFEIYISRIMTVSYEKYLLVKGWFDCHNPFCTFDYDDPYCLGHTIFYINSELNEPNVIGINSRMVND